MAGTGTTVTATFTGGTGRVDPGGMAVASGSPLAVNPVADTTYTLTVTPASGLPSTRTLTISVTPLPAAIQSFTAASPTVTAGTGTTLTATFTGGMGRVDPGGLAVASGSPLAVNPVADTTYTLTVTPASGAPRTQSLTVLVLPAVPGIPTITQPLHVTALQAGYQASVPIPTVPSTTFRWHITNGTITSDPSLRQVTFTAGAAGTTDLTCEAINAALVSSGVGPPVSCTIVPAPTVPAILPPPVPLIGEAPGAVASVALQPGCTYDWTVPGADITAGQMTHQITFTPHGHGQVVLSCEVVNQAGTRSLPGTVTVPITPPSLNVHGTFLVAPYLQLGPNPSPARMDLLWQTGDVDALWTVEVLRAGAWNPVAAPITHVVVNVGAGEPAHRVYTAALDALPGGETFYYRIGRDGARVFQSKGMALKRPDQRQRIAVVGDLFTGNAAHMAQSRAIANRIHLNAPDLMVVPGDMVNMQGRAHQYRDAFFASLNADTAGPAGAPIMRSCVLAGCLGNNDTEQLFEKRTTIKYVPDTNGLAYYYYFDQPLNGPDIDINYNMLDFRRFLTPVMNPVTHAGLLAAAGTRFPRMGNYSFDSGNVHWTVLDSDLYMQWSYTYPLPGVGGWTWHPRTPQANARLDAVKAWLDQDLAASAGARWHFVVFHHPSFNLGHGWNYGETWMRQIWPILQNRNVDLVFNGHLHGYQRSRPLSFAPNLMGTPDAAFFNNLANLNEDAAFTGSGAATRAHGVIQITTGAGGANPRSYPYPPGPQPWVPVPKPYPALLYSGNASGFETFSLLDIHGDRVEFKQIRHDGLVVDEFVLTK